MDTVSCDNAALVTRSSRWPLLIDPQHQGQTWLARRTTTTDAGLTLLRTTDADFLPRLQACIASGAAAMLCDVGTTLDSSLDMLLRKEVVHEHGRSTLKLGAIEVDYNPSFQLYLATSATNPHFAPEVFVRASVIDFTVTAEGLTEQLLADTVRHEQPELQQRKDAVVVALAQDRERLSDLRAKILDLLSNTKGNILDDDDVVAALESSRATSARIKQSVETSEASEAEIDAARARYLPAPQRASLLYFELMRLPQLDPMYHVALAYFKQLYQRCLHDAAPAEALQVRLQRDSCTCARLG